MNKKVLVGLSVFIAAFSLFAGDVNANEKYKLKCNENSGATNWYFDFEISTQPGFLSVKDFVNPKYLDFVDYKVDGKYKKMSLTEDGVIPFTNEPMTRNAKEFIGYKKEGDTLRIVINDADKSLKEFNSIKIIKSPSSTNEGDWIFIDAKGSNTRWEEELESLKEDYINYANRMEVVFNLSTLETKFTEWGSLNSMRSRIRDFVKDILEDNYEKIESRVYDLRDKYWETVKDTLPYIEQTYIGKYTFNESPSFVQMTLAETEYNDPYAYVMSKYFTCKLIR